MKKSLWVFASLLTTHLIAVEDDWGLNNFLSFWGDAAFYRRSEGGHHSLITDKRHGKRDADNRCSKCHFPKCETKTLVKRFHYEPGFQVGGAYMTRHTSLEANYLWINQWSSSCGKTLPKHEKGLFFSLRFPRFGHDFSHAHSASAHYKSHFQNGELDYFRYFTPRKGDYFSAGWMVGLRFAYLAEELNLEFHRTRKRTSNYDIHTWNRIGIAQAGLSVLWNPTRYLGWDLRLKAGTGGDWNKQHTFLGDHDNKRHLRDFHKTKFSVPFLADALLRLTYQPWYYINLHVAYQMIFLNNISLAPDQIIKHPRAEHHIRTNGHVVIHGATAGISACY